MSALHRSGQSGPAAGHGTRPAPRVSVVMSVYNGSRYVRQAVESILAQTVTDLEFIIVDDGSTDDTLTILSGFADPRIRLLINERNVGLPRSLNRAVAEGRGEYVARQDSDDVSLPDRLIRQAGYLDRNPTVGVVGVAAQWIGPQGEPLGKVWPMGAGNDQLQELLLWTCPLIHGSTMFRRHCFDEAGGYNEELRTGQDYDLWLRLSEGWDLACLPDVLYAYRQHGGMASVVQGEAQSRHAEAALVQALSRRRRHVLPAIGLGRDRLPPRLRTMTRRRLAQRYVWWSAGARHLSRALAAQFLLVSLALDPATPDIWRYVAGTLARKAGGREEERSSR